MSYIDLTKAIQSDDWARKVAVRWERFGHGWQMQGGTWDKGHSIPAGRWKNSPRIDVPPVIKRLTLRGGEFEFEFHGDKIIISRIRNVDKRFEVLYQRKDSRAPALPISPLEVYYENRAAIGKRYKAQFLRLWEQLMTCIDQPVEIEDMHFTSGFEE
jgi:hypothetical protein